MAWAENYLSGVLIDIRSDDDPTWDEGSSIGRFFEDDSVRVGNLVYIPRPDLGWTNRYDTDFVIGAKVQIKIAGHFLRKELGESQRQ